MSKVLSRIWYLFLSVAGKSEGTTRRRGDAATRRWGESSRPRVPVSPPLLILRISVVAFSVLLIFHTSSASSATISGKVEIEGRKDVSGVLVTVKEKNLSGVTSKDGRYSIPNVPSGSFTLIAQKPGCLVGVHSDVVIPTEVGRPVDVTVNFQLIPGDLKIDNSINLLDRIVLTSAWRAKEGDPNWDSMLDIYEDGVIDEKDKELLLSHWRKGNPNIKLGSLMVSSEPNGATILINGADTGETTPHNFLGMVSGEYTITLILQDYAPRDIAARIKTDETSTIELTLDNQPPEFFDWTQDPANLTEDTQGRFRVSVRVVDEGGSGLEGKIPQFAYHIGAGTTYNAYKNMVNESGDVWYYDIPEPVESWDAHRNEYVYYKVKAADVAGNERESREQSEPIDDINDPPTVRITSTFNVWEKGLLTIEADASDEDGAIAGVKFEYSFDNSRWTQIGSTDTTPPHSVPWDTTTAVVREVVKNVWTRATATDDDNASAKDITKTTFGIDNQPPITSHDYDGLWHNSNFTINLKANDGDGIGVSRIAYRLNDGNKQEIIIDGQASASVNIATEGRGNSLEYWSVDKLGNEESHRTLSDIKLDKTAPVFSDWKQDPTDLTEDAVGRFRVSVRASDEGGSGLEGNVPQIDYHIGTNTQYDGFENMVTEDGRVWHFDIPEPIDTWDAHRGADVHYKVKSEDVAGNIGGENIERTELIDDINDPPTVSITSRFNVWEKGSLTIEAESSDTDGTIAGVQFEYSPDKNVWIPIGVADSSAPFSAEWDTTASIPRAQTVWVQATATDDGGAPVTDIYPTNIGIDNQPPTTSDNYDELWHTADFAIILTVGDGDGIGVSNINVKYRLNDGDEKNLSRDGQPWITREGTNQLEYWSVDDLGNTEVHHKLVNIKLDKTAPVFADWIQDPMDLTEDSTGFLRVSVRAMDAGGSGLAGKVPQFSYRIGRDKQYSEYQSMMRGGTDDVWYYDIPEPIPPAGGELGGWDAHRGKNVYYRVKVEDVAGNPGESAEQEELIDDINDPPVVSITSRFDAWEKGSLTIEAESSDTDGTIAGMRFEYSLNKVSWTPIAALITIPPYSIQWDTTTSISEVAGAVWIKAIATDDDGRSVEHIIPDSFKIDNQPPITSHDYDGLWHNEDFVINLRANDGNGMGVASISYRLNYGNRQDVPIDRQVNVPVSITTEDYGNVLEYWSVDKLGNEGSHEILSNIKLDKTSPIFSDWKQDPVDLTEDTVGRFRVSVRATDEGASGLEGKILQIDYHIGEDTRYDGYENMISEDSNTWYFDIPEPVESWDAYRDKYVHYKVRIEDVAGNIGESPERKELIDSINDIPVVSVASTFKDWEGGQITIEAQASDIDGSVPSVQFEYSVDAVNWTPLIGVSTATPPHYSVVWDTKTVVPEVAKAVWIQVKATDADDNSVSVVDIISKSFGIDNQPASFGDWTKSPEDLTEDTQGPFRVRVNVDDGIGSGVAKVELAYRIGSIVNRAFREMTRESGNLWYYDIPEPTGTWDRYRGETLYYRARATDAVGNESPETTEQQELIDDINDPPRGSFTFTYEEWERGSLKIRVDATDDDGEVVSVQFQYSPDNVNWTDIGSARRNVPYTVTWDSTVIDADPDVWLMAVITDNDGASAKVSLTKSLGIDNKPPAFANWSHTELTEDSTESFFLVEVEITDVGSGLDSSKVQLDYRIGTAGYTGYRSMFRKTGDIWFYEIPRPGNWNNYAGKTLYYRVKAVDIAGNPAESEERSEFIDPTTGSISGTIAPRDSWFLNAKVTAQRDGVDVKQVSVSQINGSYSITGLQPGFYDLVVTAVGYGTDRSMRDVEVKAGQASTDRNVELYTYTVEEITRSLANTIEFKDKDLRDYQLIIDGNTLGQDGKVVLGLSGIEPTGVLNPEVHLLGKAIGVGFVGRSINKPLKLIMPRPSGIIDGKSIMAFIYDGENYRFVDRADIAQTDATIAITITPQDARNFSDQNHKFDKTLDRTSDTVFYVLITRFDEPQIISSDLGILDPQLTFGQITNYRQPSINTADGKIALIIHGITSKPDNFVNLIGDLRAMGDHQDRPYYDHVLVFNYEAQNTIGSNSNSLMAELADTLPTMFDSKIDVIAHGMGGLIARRAITAGGDSYIGSLTMLGTPNDGVDVALLKTGFADFLKKTQSDPAWTYYRDGWQDMLAGSSFLSALNNQSGKAVDTHYYGIAASDPGAPTASAQDNDGLVYLESVDFTDNPNFEQPLNEKFDEVPVTLPLSEGTGFMSRTRHVAMIDSSEVREKIRTYLLGKSGDIRYERYDGDLIPGQRIEEFMVELRNVGTETVHGVSAKLRTQNAYIRKYSGEQGIERDTVTFGDIPSGNVKSGTFSFDVSSSATAAIGDLVTFTSTIGNSDDNSISIEEFTVSIGGNLIQIALDPQTGEKMVAVDVREDTSRPENDGDIAVEPGEIMGLDIALKNNSSNSIPSVTATLKTTDTRVDNMAEDGIEVSYGTLAGNATKVSSFQFVKINEDLTLITQIQIHFTLDIKSGANFIGSDEFDITVGADIVVDDFDVDRRLIPGGAPEDIDVRLRNITANGIENVRISIDPDSRDVDIYDDREEFSQIRAGGTDTASFETTIEEGFAGYVLFTLEIEVDRKLINVESFRHYFGKRTQYITHWIVNDNDSIAEPGETIELQIARWNPTGEVAEDVEAILGTSDGVITTIWEDKGDYGDIPAYEVVELRSRREYEFTIAADANDVTFSAPSGSILTGTTLELPGATWTPDAFIGGTLNPNIGQAVVYTIIDNDTTTITVELNGNPAMIDVASDGDPFRISGGALGHPVEFTLDIEEDNEDMGQETFTMRIGGIIRHLPPEGYDEIRDTIDRVGLGPNNNGNGIPEPGEIIAMEVTLINITNNIDVDDVEAELDTVERGVRIDDDRIRYGRMRYGDERAEEYLVEIEDDFEGNKITFELRIEGDIGQARNVDLGADVFVIPVGNSQ